MKDDLKRNCIALHKRRSAFSFEALERNYTSTSETFIILFLTDLSTIVNP